MSRLARLLTVTLIAAAAVTGTLAGVAPSADAASTYVVRSGDSLGAIASRLDVPLDDLLRVNRLTIRSVIHPGQRLVVPGEGGSPGGSAGTTYVVKAGDWLSRIASRHGVTLTALLRANNLTATSLIVPGQRLVIPGTGGTGGGGTTGGGTNGSGTSGGTTPASTYVVKAGDWLSRIAADHDVSLNALLAANRMTVSSLILPGQVLRIPGGGGTSPSPTPPPTTQPPPRPTTPPPSSAGPRYTVRPGDSLGQIATQHRIELRSLLAANAMTAHSLIVPGQVISLPAGARLEPVDRVLNYALAQVGKPWRFFSRGPNAFDCSGLTTAAYSQIGVPLIHQSASQAAQGTAVDFRREPVRAGDLVFQDTDGDGIINHVGIALSASTWVQARNSRGAVSFGPLPADNRIVAVRRFLPTP